HPAVGAGAVAIQHAQIDQVYTRGDASKSEDRIVLRRCAPVPSYDARDVCAVAKSVIGACVARDETFRINDARTCGGLKIGVAGGDAAIDYRDTDARAVPAVLIGDGRANSRCGVFQLALDWAV